MQINFKFLGLASAMSAIVGMGQMTACTTDSAPADAGVGGTGNGDGGTVGGTGGAGGAAAVGGPLCDKPVLIPSTDPGIADFDAYNGSDISKWYFNLAGDVSLGVQAGPFGYGDIKGTDSTGAARTDLVKTFDMVTPGYNNTTYAMRIADPMAMNYGGGQGLWISTCINATRFTGGISFWVRGSTPSSQATLTLAMKETTPLTPAKASDKYGTCPGAASDNPVTCKHPNFVFPVTDTWTQIKAAWASFTPGLANGSPVMPDGRNIVQMQIDIGLNWVAGDGGVYVPTPAPYELVSDSWTFY